MVLRHLYVVGLAAATIATVVDVSHAQNLSATQPGGRIVSFGDSLSDNGNTFAQTGNPPAPYFNGRFSNGPTWVEILSNGSMNSPFQGTGVGGNVNMAFGGARADTAVNLNGPLPSVGTQVLLFQGFGGTFGPKDLVTMQGGANDIFQYFTVAGAGATQAGITNAATVAAGALVTDAGQAIAAGAKTMLVANLPDIGATPSFNGSTTTSQGGTLASLTYNGAWQQGITQLAAANPSVNIIQMDAYSLFNVIKSNPAAFGLTNVTQGCTSVSACVTGSAATQNQFLFWDGVHPTETGQQIEARYALLLINSNIMAQAIAPISEVAINARKQSTDETFDRIEQWAYGVVARQNGFYTNVTGTFADERQHGATPSYQATFGGARFGFDKQVGNSLFGGAVGVSTGNIASGGYDADVSLVNGDAYAAHLWGPFYLAGSVGGSWIDIDGRRETGIATVVAKGSTTALNANVAAEAGWILKAGGITVVPSARIAYVHSDVDGFSEIAPILALSYGRQTFDGIVGGARLRAIMPFGAPGAGRAFAEIGYEAYLSAHDDGLVARLVNNTAFPFQVATSDPLANGLNLKVGVEGRISEWATITAQYGLALQDGDGQTHSGQVRLKVPF
jgi:outer membrane lipase/esterase